MWILKLIDFDLEFENLKTRFIIKENRRLGWYPHFSISTTPSRNPRQRWRLLLLRSGRDTDRRIERMRTLLLICFPFPLFYYSFNFLFVFLYGCATCHLLVGGFYSTLIQPFFKIMFNFFFVKSIQEKSNAPSHVSLYFFLVY